MTSKKLTFKECNCQQAELIQKHRNRIRSEGREPTSQDDINWIKKYAKRFREDLKKLGLCE